MVAEVTFNGKLYFLGNESCRGSQESYLTRKSSVNVVLQYDTKWGTWLNFFFFLLFPFAFANYIIFEKRSRFRFWNPTFQCTGLSRLAKTRLRESPESKMTRMKYNCASLCNIVKERTAWDIMTQYIINDRHDDHRNPTKRTSSEIIYLNFIAWSHIMDITLLSTQSGKAYSMSAK